MSLVIYRDIAMAESLDEVRGLEGYMAATYFSLFSQFLTERSREMFSFPCRTRRPPTDPVNAMLSFGYSCLLREVMLSIGYVGLDSDVGFLHSVQAGRPSLALDMMEEFRSVLVDSLVVRLINKGEVSREDFSFAEDRCLLGISGKKIFLRAWEQKLQTKVFHPAIDCQISYRQVLEVQVRQLVHVLTQTTETYVGYRHR